MKAIVFEEIDKVKLADVEKPSLQGPGDAVVKVTLTTICGTDMHMIHGAAPMMPGDVLGHEFVGVIEELGDGVEGFEIGDRVAVACTTQCGKCEMCLKGLAAKCVDGSVFGCGPMLGNLNGSQAEHVRVPYAQFAMHNIPDALTDEQALLVGDILSTGYFAAINGKTSPGDVVAIFGGGPVGLCATACVKLFSPSKIIVVEPIAFRREMAKKMGATHTIDPTSADPVHEIKELTGGAPEDMLAEFRSRSGADVAIEAVGIKATLGAALEAVRPGGNVSIVGVFEESQEILMPQLCIKNIGVTMGLVNVVHMERLLKIIAAGMLDTTPLITHTMPLEDGVKAYEIFDKKLGDVIKIALKP